MGEGFWVDVIAGLSKMGLILSLLVSVVEASFSKLGQNLMEAQSWSKPL